MGLFGKQAGKIAGRFLGGLVGNKKLGGKLGSMAGEELIPYKNGGMVKKTGPALLHKGEIVVPKKYVKDVSKTLKNKIKKNSSK
jgi:hypothetical protein